MDIRDLRYLLAIADEGTLTGAAEALHVSRQAAAKALRTLEREAGGRLFERKGPSLSPTERGAAFAREARPVVAAFDELCANNLRHPGGAPATDGCPVPETLSIALVTGGKEALPEGFIERFCSAFPSVVLNVEEMSTDSVLAAVAEGNAEIGIVGSHPELLEGFDRCFVRPMGIWLYVPSDHPLAARGGPAGRGPVSLADLDGVALVTIGQHNHVHRFVMQRCEQAGVHPDVRATATDPELIRHLARKYHALRFGYPPEAIPLPPDIASLPLAVEGADAFGTYVIRQAGASRTPGSAGRKPSRSHAAQRFWQMARLVADAVADDAADGDGDGSRPHGDPEAKGPCL